MSLNICLSVYLSMKYPAFTMVFLDLDNTIIPTRLQQIFQTNFGIEVYSPFTLSLFNKLEENIIAAIKEIKQTIEDKDQRVVMAVVSNADCAWIQQCLGTETPQNKLKDGPIRLSKLGMLLILNPNES